LDYISVDLIEGSRVSDLITRLQMKLEPEFLLIVVNGRIADLNMVLNDGDQMNLMPALSGGNHSH
jgi:molybdopterin converting factor small subunit